MSRNVFKLLKSILPEPPLQVATILSIYGGVATLQLPGGGTIQARGTGAAGARVFVRNGLIEGAAPELPVEVIEV